MPNRILREGILTSDRVNALSLGAELFYRRLMSVVDDFGRFDARTVMLKVTCFPLRVNDVRDADLSRWLTECEAAGLIRVYAVDGKRYLEMADFRQAQRAKESKFPGAPPDGPMRSKCDADATQATVGCDAPAPEGEGDMRSRISKTEARKPKVAAAPLPPWMPPEWRDWIDHRGRKATPQAQALQIAKLSELRDRGHDPSAVIRLAIESGWATFYEPKPPRKSNGNGGGRAPTLAEREAATMDEITGRSRRDERDITDYSERVDRSTVHPFPVDLRNAVRSDVGEVGPEGLAANVG